MEPSFNSIFQLFRLRKHIIENLCFESSQPENVQTFEMTTKHETRLCKPNLQKLASSNYNNDLFLKQLESMLWTVISDNITNT